MADGHGFSLRNNKLMDIKVVLTIDELAELFIHTAEYQAALEFAEDEEAFETLMNEVLFTFCGILNVSEDSLDNFTQALLEAVDALEAEEK